MFLKSTSDNRLLRLCAHTLLYSISIPLFFACNAPSGNISEDCAAVPHLDAQTPKQVYFDPKNPWQRRLHNDLDVLMRSRASNAGFNGAILVAIRDTIIYENYFGAAYRDSVAFSPNTASHIASISKTFTAAAVLYLQEQKKIDINNLITVYIPNFPYPNIRIIDLLAHRSGLPNYSYFMDTVWVDKPNLLDNQTLVEQMCALRPEPYSLPDSRFHYCNTNFALLAYIVEQVSKTPFDKFLRCTFFEPLGMQHTFVYTPASRPLLPPFASESYYPNWQPHPLKFDDGVLGDKNVYSTVDDLYIWERALSRGKVLSVASLEAAYKPYSNEHIGIKNYGLGWRLLLLPTQKVIFHNGWWHGNTSSLYRFPKDDITIICLSNKYTRLTYGAQEIYSLIKGYDAEIGLEEE